MEGAAASSNGSEPHAGGMATEPVTPETSAEPMTPATKYKADLLQPLGAALSEEGLVDEHEVETMRLRMQRAALIKERKASARLLRNAERKRKRLCEKAEAMSTADLLQIVAVRSAREAKRSKNAAAASAAGEPDASEDSGAEEDHADGEEGADE